MQGGFQRGTDVPLCVVAGVGFIGEGPHRKGPAPMRFFGYFLSAQKVTRVRAGEARELSNRMAVPGEEKCFSPARPAIRESALHRPDAQAQNDQKRWGQGAKPPKNLRYLSILDIKHLPLEKRPQPVLLAAGDEHLSVPQAVEDELLPLAVPLPEH